MQREKEREREIFMVLLKHLGESFLSTCSILGPLKKKKKIKKLQFQRFKDWQQEAKISLEAT
jgi:hypothetical protein